MSNHYMPLFCGDYLGDTMHLSCEEHGAYMLLLMSMWRRRGWVPDDDDDLSRVVRLDRAAWQVVKKRLRPLLTFKDGQITQKRLLAEVERSRKVSEARSKASHCRPRKNSNLADTNDGTTEAGHTGLVWSNTEEKKNKKAEVPEDWVPTPEQVERLKTNLGCVDGTITVETIKFRNFHRSKGNTFKRVAQAFDNWMVNAEQYSKRAESAGVRKSAGGYLIKTDSEEYTAWKRHALKIGDDRLLGRLKYCTGGEALVPTRWPQFK